MFRDRELLLNKWMNVWDTRLLIEDWRIRDCVGVEARKLLEDWDRSLIVLCPLIQTKSAGAATLNVFEASSGTEAEEVQH